MSSSFSGPTNPKDQIFADRDVELSGPPLPPDQLSADLSDNLVDDDEKESGTAAGA